MLKNLHDVFIKDFSKYPPGLLVVGKVLSIELPKVQISLKPSDIIDPKDRLQFENLELDNCYTGIVRQIKPFGLFIRLDNSILDALCYIKEISDDEVNESEINSLYNVGDKVRIIIIGLDAEKKRISCSLKHSRFEALNITEIQPIENEEEDDDDEDESEESEDDEEEIENIPTFTNDTLDVDLWSNTLYQNNNTMEIENSESEEDSEEETGDKSKSHSSRKTYNNIIFIVNHINVNMKH